MTQATAHRLTLTLLAGALLAACSTRDLEPGKRVPSWRLEELWRVGGETSGPHSFDAEFGLELLPDGSLLHFDYQEETFYLLDQTGAGIAQFGRKGSGPGEVLNANGFAVSPSGTIVVNDRGNNRLVLFDQTGRSLGEVPVPWKFTRGLPWDARFLDDGRLIERYALPTQDGWTDVTRVWSIALDTSEVLGVDSCTVSPAPAGGEDHLAIVNAKGDPIPRQYVPVPYSGAWTATAIDPGGFIWGQPVDKKLSLLRFPLVGCEPRAMIRLPASTALIPKARLDSAVAFLRRAAASIGGQVPDDLPLPTHFPPFFTVHVDRLRRVWVQGFDASGAATMSVFDSMGTSIATIDSFPLGTRTPLVFTKDRVYGFETDDSGIKYLVAFQIVH